MTRRIAINDHEIPWSSAATPAELPWGTLVVGVAVECTGRFRSADAAGGHLEAGARKVVLSAPGKGVDVTVVMVKVLNDASELVRHVAGATDARQDVTVAPGSQR